MSLNLMLSAKWYPFLFDVNEKTDFARTITFWLTIALAIAFAVSLFLIKGEKRNRFLKIVLPIAICYICAVAGMFLYFGFKEDGIVNQLFYPLLILILIIAVSAITLCFKRTKPVVISVICLVLVALVAVLISIGVYYSSGKAEEFNGLLLTTAENFGLYISSILLVFVLLAVAFFVGKTDKSGFDSKSIAYASLCIAMSFALSYIRIVKLPQGGSITLASLVPLMLYSYMFGVKKGIFAGFIYGLLQAIQDPYIVHPMQFLLDYPIAFASIGIAGVFGKFKPLETKPQIQFAIGACLASVLRFICHVFSGVFAFSEYAYSSAGDPMNPWLYSIGYNSFVFADIAIAIVVGVILLSSKSFVKQVKKYNNQQV